MRTMENKEKTEAQVRQEERDAAVYAAFKRKVAKTGRTEAYEYARKATRHKVAYATCVKIVKRMEAREGETTDED